MWGGGSGVCEGVVFGGVVPGWYQCRWGGGVGEGVVLGDVVSIWYLCGVVVVVLDKE